MADGHFHRRHRDPSPQRIPPDRGRLEARPPRDARGPQRGRDAVGLRRRRLRLALPVTLAAVKSHRARQAAGKLKAGETWTDTGLVFTTEAGTPIDPANLRRAFRALILPDPSRTGRLVVRACRATWKPRTYARSSRK